MAKPRQQMGAGTRTASGAYRQDWTAYVKAQVHEKSRFQELLYALCQGVEEPIQTAGRPRLPLSDMIFSAAFKVYSTLSVRRFASDLREAQSRGYVERAPHHNSVSNYLEMESLTPYLHQLITQSAQPLKAVETAFAADSSGFRTCGYVRWFNVKYGEEQKKHDWLKLHIFTGVQTNVVVHCETSHRHANDSPYFKPLITAAADAGFNIREVSADKAYSTRDNLRLVTKNGGMSYIDFKDNAKGGSKCAVWNKVYYYYCLHREEFYEHYHKRSNVETTFWMIKSKFGEQIRSKTATAQTNEALCKVLCHNLCCVVQSMYELGMEPVFWPE